MKITVFAVCLLAFAGYHCSTPRSPSATHRHQADSLLDSLMATQPSWFGPVLRDRDNNRVQILYSRIDRRSDGQPIFTDYSYHLTDSLYYYPASTVKLPVAALALQRLHELAIPGLDRETTFLTGAEGDGQTAVTVDSSSADLRPTIGQYVRKILLVSDNDAFNRLYEFLGQEYINQSLHRMGYDSTQIIHRLAISLTDQQNRHSNPCRFVDRAGRVIYEQPGRRSTLPYAQRNTKLGRGYMRGDSLISQPLDFSTRNRFLLRDLHGIVRSILFPEAVPPARRFRLTEDDYRFLRRFMSMTPGESQSPAYDTVTNYANYVKFLYYGAEKTQPDPHIRIFNKVGDAYGFLIDAIYFADFEHGIEFQLSAVIYCNADGILNDDKYDYDELGFPFMKRLGRLIYEYERNRKKAVVPDLSTFRIEYK